MYFPYFAAYILTGAAITVFALAWALKNNQFSDQNRARFLPLDQSAKEARPKVTRFNRLEGYALMILAAAGLSATCATLIFSLVAYQP